MPIHMKWLDTPTCFIVSPSDYFTVIQPFQRCNACFYLGGESETGKG